MFSYSSIQELCVITSLFTTFHVWAGRYLFCEWSLKCCHDRVVKTLLKQIIVTWVVCRPLVGSVEKVWRFILLLGLAHWYNKRPYVF